MTMDLSLQKYPIADDIQTWLLKELWLTPATSPRASSLGMLPYFDRYSELCQFSSRNGGAYIGANSHQDLVDITKQILLQDATRDELHSSLYANCPKDEHGEDQSSAIYSTLDLCGSLLLMAEVGKRKFTLPNANHLTWSGPQTLRQVVEKHFRPERELQSDSPKLGMEFTARNLAVIGGIKVKWTDNIVLHLRLSDDDQTVFVFHHVGFLRFLQGGNMGCESPLFPEPFIDETLHTMALLFPQNCRRSRRWLLGQISENRLDPDVARCGFLRSQERRIERFSFWHDRLIVLKQAFDESSPRGLQQWWNDRRNSVQWSTFWVAILVFVMTVFFGLVQSIEGGMQVYLSWKALHGEGG